MEDIKSTSERMESLIFIFFVSAFEKLNEKRNRFAKQVWQLGINGYFFRTSCNSTGSLVVMKSTLLSISHFMSLGSFTVQALTFIPRS